MTTPPLGQSTSRSWLGSAALLIWIVGCSFLLADGIVRELTVRATSLAVMLSGDSAGPADRNVAAIIFGMNRKPRIALGFALRNSLVLTACMIIVLATDRTRVPTPWPAVIVRGARVVAFVILFGMPIVHLGYMFERADPEFSEPASPEALGENPSTAPESRGLEATRKRFFRLPAPAFELQLLDGTHWRYDPSTDQGAHLLVFWASWCKPCIDSFPEIRRIAARFARRGLDVVMISLDEDEQKAREAISRLEPPGRAAWLGPEPWSHPVVKAFRVSSIPHEELISRGGTSTKVDVRRPGTATWIEQVLATSRADYDRQRGPR